MAPRPPIFLEETNLTRLGLTDVRHAFWREMLHSPTSVGFVSPNEKTAVVFTGGFGILTPRPGLEPGTLLRQTTWRTNQRLGLTVLRPPTLFGGECSTLRLLSDLFRLMKKPPWFSPAVLEFWLPGLDSNQEPFD